MIARSDLRAFRLLQYGRAFACAAVLLAALGAALLAHLGIDFAGDYLLPHDAYDDVTHSSRALACAGALVLLLGLALRLLCAALDEARGSGAALRRVLEPVLGRSPVRFVLLVTLFSLAALMAMESLDTVLENGRIDDLADLLGGSTALGIGILVPTALLAGAVVWRLLRAVWASHRAISRALGILFVALDPRACAGFSVVLREAVPPRSASPPAHRAGLRAPPPVLT